MEQSSVLAPSQHSQSTRKGKKAWRKNVDITEIQDGLEDVRQEVIQGGVVAELPSSALFTADSIGSTDIKQAYISRHKPLKTDEILAQRSAIPAVSSRKRSGDSKVTDGIMPDGNMPDGKRRKQNGISAKHYEHLRKIAYGGERVKKDVVKADGSATFDPWEPVPPPLPDPNFSFLDEKKPVQEPPTLKRAPVSMAKDGREIKAVRKPDAGKSYNPLFDDWQARLVREGAKEVEAEKRRLEEQAKEQERLERIAKAQEEAEKELELDSEWESEWEGIASEHDETPEWLSKKRPVRKTQAERNKIKRRIEEQRRKVGESKQRKREAQAERIKALAREVKDEERLRGEKSNAKAVGPPDDSSDDGEDIAVRKHKFGKASLPDAPLEVVLADELEESLRLLRPEGNLLKDRFRTMMLRGKIESRKAISQHKKPKRTSTEKWSYKDWKLK